MNLPSLNPVKFSAPVNEPYNYLMSTDPLSHEETPSQIAPAEITPYYKRLSLKIGKFLKENWKKILIYLIAWVLIIASYGAICGFTNVAVPFTIWLSIGFGIGFVFGVITAMWIDPKNKWQGKNSLWDLMNAGFFHLDENGTRQVLLASVITIISTCLTAFPEAIGCFIGFCAGNQLGLKMCYGLKLGVSNKKKFSEKEKKKIKYLNNLFTINSLVKENFLIKKENLDIKRRLSQLEHHLEGAQSSPTSEPELITEIQTEDESNSPFEAAPIKLRIDQISRTLQPAEDYDRQEQNLNMKIQKCDDTAQGIRTYLAGLKKH